jgi:transcription antitermination factor NusG
VTTNPEEATLDGAEGGIEADDLFRTPQWYAMTTRARHEKKVLSELTARSIEAFLPTYQRWSRWKDRVQKIEQPLFPGYCFARFSLAERLGVVRAHGVAQLVGMNGRPEPVLEHEIEAIRRLVASWLPYDPHPLVLEGMEVVVVRGPLTGVRGKLVRKDRSSRLLLSVTLVRQAVSVSVHPADVAAV